MHRRLAIVVVSAALLLMGVACGDDVAPETEARERAKSSTDDVMARGGFPCRTLRVTAADGTVTDRCVWVADTPERMARGLMGVTDPELGGRGALVFAPGTDSELEFWMVDTLVPLTVVWVDAGGSVIRSADMQPCTTTEQRCERHGAGVPWRLAIEVPSGADGPMGLVPGARIELLGDC